MKYLKIDDNKGYYWDGSNYQEIDKIDKDGLLVILKSAEADDFEMDAYDENLIGNRAHQIIYENIHSKLEQFLSDKDQFRTEVDKLYKEAIQKYSVEINDNEPDDIEIFETQVENADPDDIPF